MNTAVSTHNESLLIGEVTKVVFSNKKTAWCVLEITDEQGGIHTAVGEVAGVHTGEQLEMEGYWARSRFGREFQVKRLKAKLPITPEGIRMFLAEVVEGIGPQISKRIVDKFGTKTYEILDKQMSRIQEVTGIGPTLFQRIQKAWKDHTAFREVLGFLLEHGVGTANAWKIYRRYGEMAVRIMMTNPWQPARDIKGIGFKTADKLALSLGISFDCENRLHAAAVHALREAADEGHLFLRRNELVKQTQKILEARHEDFLEKIDTAIDTLANTKAVIVDTVKDDKLFYLPYHYEDEVAVAAWFASRIHEPVQPPPFNVAVELDSFEEREKFCLSKVQRAAVELAIKSRFNVLTGGPGTGKSTILKAIVYMYRRAGKHVVLASPTGRAAARMSELTGVPACTIHRLLKFDGSSFVHNAENKLKLDVLILDEVSMLDMHLLWAVLRSLPKHVCVIFVGDRDQLPSVGPGAVLNELIACNLVPTVTLTEIFRQAKGSQIAICAQQINNGKFPTFHANEDPNGDCYFAEEENPDVAADILIDLATKSIPKHLGINPIKDIQVLAPMKRGSLGVDELNLRLQRTLNPFQPNVEIGKTNFRVNDRVMQLRNNYELGIFNGDVGYIQEINQKRSIVRITFEGRDVVVPFAMMDSVGLAYAITIHKSQGGQFPVVLIVCHTQQYKLLQRNLVYTGLTRARRLAIFVGNRKGMQIAIGNNNATKRNTLLATRIKTLCECPPALSSW